MKSREKDVAVKDRWGVVLASILLKRTDETLPFLILSNEPLIMPSVMIEYSCAKFDTYLIVLMAVLSE